MKIILYGDSILKRLGKEAVLTLESYVPNSTVYNCSTGGFDTRDGLRRAELIAQLPIDVVVLCFGMNDAAPWKPVELSQFKENMIDMVRIFGVSRTILLVPPSVNESLQEGEGIRNNGILNLYIEVIEGLARDMGCVCVNPNSALTASGTMVHLDDGVHLNEAGERILLSVLGGVLTKFQS